MALLALVRGKDDFWKYRGQFEYLHATKHIAEGRLRHNMVVPRHAVGEMFCKHDSRFEILDMQ